MYSVMGALSGVDEPVCIKRCATYEEAERVIHVRNITTTHEDDFEGVWIEET